MILIIRVVALKEKLKIAEYGKKSVFEFYKTVATEVIKYSNRFFMLINGEHTLDDILEFIYSFLEHFKILKKELYEKHKKELLQKNWKFHC
ncbi:Plasmodium exported protein, unknown function [Plasmodium reichenowi]|uniref:Uncharacterized protein n=1 Tax=Plasmodium reichenowi TaxID=5854 RepID=A0A2P9DSY7_PLARE|nr:Plasmodium exported protein, unknown function [Plasmodium reichenowi]